MASTPISAAEVAAACREHAAALAESLNLCFGRQGSLTPGEPAPWSERPATLAGPGLMLRAGTAGGGLLGLIRADLPLPDLFAAPDESRQDQLRILASDWSVLLLPPDVVADVLDAEPVPDLAAAAAACLPDDSAELIPLATEEGPGTIFVLAPVGRLLAEEPVAAPVADRAAWESAHVEARNPTAYDSGSSPAREVPPQPRRPQFARLLPVPVQVVVRLAERKIEMGQLLSLAPGSLITFSKNCEDLLDLYVNNRLYCRGEAVKIGENFGLKINEVGAVRRREERVF